MTGWKRLRDVWDRAGAVAAATPPERNRYVDFLRAASIAVVVIGHWLMAAPYVRDGELVPVNMLAIEPWTQWLTWIFQVMPVFFVVGGYANAASWRPGSHYGTWLANRLRRLTLPAVPLVAVWTGIALGARAFGVDGSLVRLGSQSALIPLWFLAVYVVVVAVTPITLAWWRRAGWWSFAGVAALALVVDVARFATHDLVGWANFVFVWVAIHQLGYAWHDGRFGSPEKSAAVAAIGLAGLVGLVTVGPYPVAMVGVPGTELTNTSPPTIALVALGVFHTGLLLAAERPTRRLLVARRAWTATVAVNGMIMSLYLWHLTVMVLTVGAAMLLGGLGLTFGPSQALWWSTRPVWIALLVALTVPVVVVTGRWERPAAITTRFGATTALVAAGLACLGFGNIAGGGIGDADHWVRPLAVLPVLAAGLLLWIGTVPSADRELERV